MRIKLMRDWMVKEVHGEQSILSPLPFRERARVRVGLKAAVMKDKREEQQTLAFRRRLRMDSTDAENALWRLLRGRQFSEIKFRRQHPFGPYVLDFYCPEYRLAIEVDGGQHFDGH